MKKQRITSLAGSGTLRQGKRILRSLPIVAGLLLCAPPTAKAADNPSVKFNSGVRYSQWAINSRLHDFYGNQKKFGFDYYDASGNLTKSVTWKNGEKDYTRIFDYVPGLVGKASLEAADYYENFDWSKPWFYAAQGYATGTPYANSKMTLDNMNAAKMYLPILAGKWKSPEATTVANNAITAVIKNLSTYNTQYAIGTGTSALNSTNANDVQKTMFGGWFHKSTDYTDQMWCDGQYMGPALLAQIIKHTGKTNNISDNDWDIITKQFNITWAQLHDGATGLLYHGFTANPGDNASSSWAGISKDKGIYHSASFWGRANAWYFMALVDVLEAMPADNGNYATLKGYLTSLASAIKKYQDSESGCWYQILDKTPASLSGNYLEASCSSIFTAAYLKAIRLGLLDKATYEPVAKKAYEGLVTQFMVYDNTDNNTIQLVKSCTSAGLGGSDKRAGNDNYYLTGKDAGVVTSADPSSQYYYTEGKVLGGFIMAATEYERAYQNQDSKQILFARDLADSYDFSSDASGKLDATAYGEGTVSYQWYKDGAAVADATSATYSPTETGEYYCTATANGNTITTSTANVTAVSSNGEKEEETPSASEGTVTFSGDDLKLYKSPMTDNTKTVTITTTTGSISGESSYSDIKVPKSAAFTISVPEGKYIKSIAYTMLKTDKGVLSFNPDDKNKVTSSDSRTYTYNYTDNTLRSVTVTNATGSGAIQVTSIKVIYGSTSSTPSTEKYAVTASMNPTEAGSVTILNGTEKVTSGTEVAKGTKLTFKVNKEYLGQYKGAWAIKNWTINGVEQSNTSEELTTTVDAATEVVANAKLVYFTWMRYKGVGTVTIECNGTTIAHGGTVDAGSTVTFTATPATGYKFVKWVDGEDETIELGTSRTLVVENIAKDYNACAVFEKEKYPVNATAGEGGTVSIKSSNDVITSGSEIEYDTQLTFTATANDGYEFVNWTDASNNAVSTENPYTATVSAAINIKANFKKKEDTPATGSANFTNDDIKLLASVPTGEQKSELSDGKITIKAGKAITYNEKNGGLNINKSSNSDFTISAVYGAKITKVIIEQTPTNRELTYSPSGTSSYDRNSGKYTYTYETDKPADIKVSFSSAGNIYVKSIIVEYETAAVKTDLTATFANSTINATEGDADVDMPALTVTDVKGNTLAENIDYTVSYQSNNENVAKYTDGKIKFVGKGNAIITATVTPKNTNLYNDNCKAELTVNVKEKSVEPDPDPSQSTLVVDFNNNVGTITSGNTAIKVNGNNTIVFGANYKPAEGKYIKMTPKDGGKFKAGDVITIVGTSTKGNAKLTLNSSLDASGDEQFQTQVFGSKATTFNYTIQAECDAIYIGRYSGSSTIITSLTVARGAATDKTRLVATFESNSTTVINTTKTISLPKLTVKAGDTELTGEDYTIEKASDNEDVLTISGDEITIKGVGTATVTATITPTDADNYVGCTATYQVTVKEPTPLNIQTVGVTMNTTDAEVEQPIIKVYGDDDKLLKLGTDYKLKFDVTSGSNVTVTDAGTFKVDGSAYAWTKGTTTFTVTATPTTSLGDTYTAGTLSFDYAVVEGKIKPQFLQAFAQSGTIKLAKDGKNKEFTVPLLYNGGDVSKYFDFTFDVKCTEGTANKSTSTSNKLTFTKTNEGKFTVTVSAKPHADAKDENDDYTDVYDAPDDLTFNLEVSASYKLPVITTDPVKMSMYTGTTAELPDVTVTVGGNVYTGDYNTTWVSFTPGLINVDQTRNRIEGVREGKAQIRVTISGDELETTTAFVDIYVDDPALYRAKDTDQDNQTVFYGNQKVMSNQDNTMSVKLGGWMFPNAVSKGVLETLSSEWAWENKAAKPKWKLSDFDFYVAAGEKQKNARQENGSNAMPESTTTYDATFNKQGTVVDKMFNVPCSGSFLVFNPKTSGRVNVHIFQNGVFDKHNSDYQYRPQRRVFVMDEAGNFVSSDAHIESTTGKPTGGIKALSNYKWDLSNNQAPTEADVVSHFTGLETFSMTDEGFKNNVYESALSNDVAPNAAAKDGVKGSHGWCVLADSPVTYSFRVKPGKTYYLYNYGSKIGFYGYSFEEDDTKPTVDEVSYDELSSNNNVKSTEEGHIAKVSINRSFKAGIWSSCVLPFSLNKEQVDAIFGTTYGMTSNNDGTSTTHADGTQILYFDHVDSNGKVWFVRHAYNTIVANKPFLIKPTKTVESFSTADCTEYPYVTIEAPDTQDGKPADWCADGRYAWKSSYNMDMPLSEGDGYIGASSGNFIQYKGSGSTVKAFRGYLKGLTNEAKTHALTTATSSNTDGDGSTTFINGLVIDSEGNLVQTESDGKVYNVNGQIVADGINNLNSLPSGVYIINGKKYVK